MCWKHLLWDFSLTINCRRVRLSYPQLEMFSFNTGSFSQTGSNYYVHLSFCYNLTQVTYHRKSTFQLNRKYIEYQVQPTNHPSSALVPLLRVMRDVYIFFLSIIKLYFMTSEYINLSCSMHIRPVDGFSLCLPSLNQDRV